MAERLAGSGGTTQWTDYLFAGGDMIGMRVEHSVSGVYTRYFHKDHLGSISTITDETGAVVERLSYDAWGKRRNIDGTDDPAGIITSQTTRGFTGHEQLAEVGLVHMNGRVYDPLIGRFGSADPMTEAPYSTQGWNRYAYVGNSPLNFNDPTGFCFMGCFWQKPFKALGNLLRSTPIVGQLLQVAGAIACGPGAFVCVGLVSAAITGIASGDLGQALKAGVIAAATAAAMFQVGELTGSQSLNLAGAPNGGHAPLDFLSEAHVFNMAGHAAVGCGSAAASGGECGAGALSGATGSFASNMPFARNLSFEEGLVFTSVSGGLSSVAGGGKFGNGAVTAAFGYLYNEFGTNRQRGYREGRLKEGIGAIEDFAEGYGDLRRANTIGADKYFHCRANCEATQRGPLSENLAENLSDFREYADRLMGDPLSASVADQQANRLGRSLGITSFQSCSTACRIIAPKGLSNGPWNYKPPPPISNQVP